MVEFNPPIERYDERWKDWREEEPQLVKLRNILLGIGGKEVVPNFEPDVEKIVSNGQKIKPEDTVMIKGESSQCHRNTALLFESDEYPYVTEIGTGWALSDDGLWRQHSWGMRGSEIAETTVPREIYFGIILDDDEAKKFCRRNR